MTISAHVLNARYVTPYGFPGFYESFDLEVNDLTITLDEGWSPYCQATLELALPPAEQLRSLDPRLPGRVMLRLDQRFGSSDPLSTIATMGTTLADITSSYAGDTLADWTDQHGAPFNAAGPRPNTSRLFNLGLRDVQVDHEAGTVSLVLASDEGLLQDYAPSSPTPIGLNVVPLGRSYVQYALAQIGAGLALHNLTNFTVPADASPDITKWAPGVNGWDWCEGLVQAVDLRLWCDERRIWHLDTPLGAGTGSIELDALTGLSDGLTREQGWADAVVIEYRWSDLYGNSRVAYDTATSAGASRTMRIRRDTPFPGTGAAASMLRRARTRGRRLSAECVSDYSVTPGQLATITPPGADPVDAIVSAVSWSLPSDRMTVATREVES